MITQLNPAIPMNTPKGLGICHFVIDYGPESDLYWVVFIDETGELWTFNNKEIRGQKNITLGRSNPSVCASLTLDEYLRFTPLNNSDEE